MMKAVLDFISNAVFTYCLTNLDISEFKNFKQEKFCDLNLYLSNNTDFLWCEKDECFAGVVGYCIDSHNEIDRFKIPEYILCSLKEDTGYEGVLDRFAGKYAVFVKTQKNFCVFTDATATLPVFYLNDEDKICISSHEYMIKVVTGCGLSNKSTEIVKKGDRAKTLPSNLSFCENVYSLLPNTYFDVNKNAVVRLKREVIESNLQDVCRKIVELSTNICDDIGRDFDIKCALTEGYDSRAVFAFLKNKDIETYTMTHGRSKEENQLKIPKLISERFNKKYTYVYDSESTDERKKLADEIFGKGLYSEYTLMLTQTLQEYIGDSCILNGDIIGQIGKNSLNRTVPDALIGHRFLTCKLHNTSRITKKEMKKWYDVVKGCYKRSLIGDIFSEEIRLGRWAANENVMYSTFGIKVMNIFNCKEIIALMESVNKEQRTNALIHKEIMRILEPQLLEYPFNTADDVRGKILKKTTLGFYIATFAKYYIQVINNMLNRR